MYKPFHISSYSIEANIIPPTLQLLRGLVRRLSEPGSPRLSVDHGGPGLQPRPPRSPPPPPLHRLPRLPRKPDSEGPARLPRRRSLLHASPPAPPGAPAHARLHRHQRRVRLLRRRERAPEQVRYAGKKTEFFRKGCVNSLWCPGEDAESQ